MKVSFFLLMCSIFLAIAAKAQLEEINQLLKRKAKHANLVEQSSLRALKVNSNEQSSNWIQNFFSETYESKALTEEVKPDINFHNTFGIKAEKIITNIKFDHNGLLNGVFYMKFYEKKDSHTTKAFFYGNFKNGYADRFCRLVTLNFGKDTTWHDWLGYFKHGDFAFRNDIEQLTNRIEKEIDYTSFSLDTSLIVNKKIEIMDVFCKTDPLNSAQMNGGNVVFTVTFQYKNVPHYLRFKWEKKDFFDPENISFQKGDGAFQSNHYSLKSNIRNVVRKMNLLDVIVRPETRENKWYDTYLTFDQSYWHSYYSEICDLSNSNIPDDNGEGLMGWFKAKMWSKDATVTISYRTSDSSVYQSAGSFSLDCYKDCYDRREYRFIEKRDNEVPNFKGVTSYQTYSEMTDHLAEYVIDKKLTSQEQNQMIASKRQKDLQQIQTIKKQFTLEDSLVEIKKAAIFSRIENSHDFEDSSEYKPVIGIWFWEKKNELLWIEPGDKESLYFTYLNYSTLFGEKGYPSATYNDLRIIKSDKNLNFNLNHDFDFYLNENKTPVHVSVPVTMDELHIVDAINGSILDTWQRIK